MLDKTYLKLQPLLETYKLELKKNKKKFVIFAIVDFLIFFFLNVYLYLVFGDYPLPDTINEYYQSANGSIYINDINNTGLVILFASCFFFSGIICTEYGGKTGLIVLPKINRYILLIGKYLGAFTHLIGVIAIYYIAVLIGGAYFYDGISLQLFVSFGVAVLFALAISSFVTLFSSFTKRENMTIIYTLLILIFAFTITDLFVQALSNGKIEPIYSLMYPSNLIEYSTLKKLPNPRYEDVEYLDGSEIYSTRFWITPTFEMGIIVLVLYTVLFLSLAAWIFKRRQL